MAQTPTVETIYNFTHQSGGAPAAGVTIGSGGELYGTTDGSGIGTVFSLTPPSAPGGLWTEHILHEFSNSPDGFLPQAGVTVGPGGIVYVLRRRHSMRAGHRLRHRILGDAACRAR